MGTRGLTCVVLGGEFKVAQYGQWDHYPGGQGSTIAHFFYCVKLDKFKEAVAKCRFISAEESNKKMEAFVPDMSPDGWLNMDQAAKLDRYLPELMRNAGAKILNLILLENKHELQDNREFAAESLYCEWAYVIDLDTEMIEVYRGFNKTKPIGRFAKLKVAKGEKYKPVTLFHSFPIADAVKGMAETIQMDQALSEKE